VQSLITGNERTSAASSQPPLMRSFDGTFDAGFVIRNDWNLILWKRPVGGDYLSLFDCGTIIGNPLNLPIKSDALGGDDHWCMAFGLDSRNVCHMMGNSHADAWYYTTKDLSTWPPSTTWTTPSFASLPWNNTGIQMHTYANFVRTSDGTLILFADQETSAVPTTAGRNVTAWYLPPGTSTWLPMLNDGRFANSAQNAPAGEPDRAYICGVTLEARANNTERLHACCMWARRDTASGPFSKWNPFYCYSDGPFGSNTAWKTITGATVTFPITFQNYTPLLITSAPQFDATGGPSLMIDTLGYPHIIVANGSVTTSGQSFLELYWDGSAWQSSFVPGQGTGASTPGIYRLKNDIYYVTTAFGRLRVVAKANNKAFVLGGMVENGIRPVPEPQGTKDSSRLSFLIPEGDLPAVYDISTVAVPHP
jgi:hypothetical protein